MNVINATNHPCPAFIRYVSERYPIFDLIVIHDDGADIRIFFKMDIRRSVVTMDPFEFRAMAVDDESAVRDAADDMARDAMQKMTDLLCN